VREEVGERVLGS
jgi:hypothetical protein